MQTQDTFYQVMRRHGVTRRSFLKFCSLTATSLGLSSSMIPQIAYALENKPRTPVIWLHGLECTCCTESFIRSAHPLAKDAILSLISLDYDDTIMAAAGQQAEQALADVMREYKGNYIVAVEGNAPLNEDGMFCILAGEPFLEKLKRVSADAKAIIAWGSCASWGCVQAARPNPTKATPVHKLCSTRTCARPVSPTVITCRRSVSFFPFEVVRSSSPGRYTTRCVCVLVFVFCTLTFWSRWLSVS